MSRIMKRIAAVLATAAVLAACVPARPGARAAADEVITSREQLNQPGRKIGVGTGSASAEIAEKEFPNATIVYFTENVSAYQNVAQGKADAYVFERSQMQLALDNGLQGVHLLDENLEEKIHIAVGISPVSRIPDLKGKLNTFIAEIRANGILDEMYDRWVNQKNETMPAITPAEHPAFTLKVGTSGIVPPFSYYTGQELKGYDIELAYRFAAWLGADVSFSVFDYDAIVPAAVSGKVDCLMANLNVTPEREEAIPFSDDLYTADIGILVRGDAAAGEGGTSFWSGISESFRKTFIREDRWQLFVNGVMTTLLITVLSILCGTLLGFLAFMLCRNGNAAANGIARFTMWLVQGMPMVVLLLVLYYIVFGSVTINGIAVAVIGFTLTFGSEVFGLLKMGVGTIDRGQYEASYALGYSNRHTFFRIILPQAVPHILPAYKGEVVGLIKATAIVGYIAVQDLTKMGDIVRSRTYEAFFPLIDHHLFPAGRAAGVHHQKAAFPHQSQKAQAGNHPEGDQAVRGCRRGGSRQRGDPGDGRSRACRAAAAGDAHHQDRTSEKGLPEHHAPERRLRGHPYRRRNLRDRSLRNRKEYTAALHQSAGEAHGRPYLGQRDRSDRTRMRPGQSAAENGHGLPVLQPVRPPDRYREYHAGPDGPEGKKQAGRL